MHFGVSMFHTDYPIPAVKQMVVEAGRSPDAAPITLFGGTGLLIS